MAVDLQGNIIDEEGNKSGQTVNLDTGQVSGTITSDLFKRDGTPDLNLPRPNQPRDFSGITDANLDSFLADFNAPTQEETFEGDIQSRILETLDTLGGQSERRQELEAEAGVGTQRTELQGILNQLQGLQKESAAIPLQIQEEFSGRGVTAGGAEPIEISRQRRNAIQSLGLAAIGQTLQGNLSLAETTIANALEAEFEPEENRLKQLNQLYTFNRDTLERQDKKRADLLNIQLAERARILENDKVDRQEIYNMSQTALKFGADTATAQKMLESGSKEEAILIGGRFLQDPIAQQQLANSKLDFTLKKLQIQQKAEEIDIFRKYGGLTPKQWEEARQVEEDALQDQDIAVTQGVARTKDIDQINTILNSRALDSVVGPTPFTRATGRARGFGPTILSVGGIGGIGDALTGGSDDVIALTEQITSQEFLNKLVAEKGKGATFGQLSDREGDALRSAALAVNQTAIRNKNDKVIGYDMSEKEFKNQLTILRTEIERLYEKTTGEAFTPAEKAELEALDEALSPGQFNPAF